MREIKFRAWDNISKRMHNHIGKVCDNGKAESREDIGALVDGQNSGHYILHDCILMQFTGLKDKNGVDIYEGDLLRNEDWIRDAHAYNTWDRVIEWDKNNACFLGVDGEVCEVIGNIYENPELLKNEQSAFKVLNLKIKYMGGYDLYGTYYPNVNDAINAEMAQCAAIDADIAMREVMEMKNEMVHQQSQDPILDELKTIWEHIRVLEGKVKTLENTINPF